MAKSCLRLDPDFDVISKTLEHMKSYAKRHDSLSIVGYRQVKKEDAITALGTPDFASYFDGVYNIKVACGHSFLLITTNSATKKEFLKRECKRVGKFILIALTYGAETIQEMKKAIIYLIEHAVRFVNKKLKRDGYARPGQPGDSCVRRAAYPIRRPRIQAYKAHH